MQTCSTCIHYVPDVREVGLSSGLITDYFSCSGALITQILAPGGCWGGGGAEGKVAILMQDSSDKTGRAGKCL